VIADLDTLLIALYVELTDQIIPLPGFTRSGPGQRPEVTGAELVCLAVAQVLLRLDDERHWLRAAAKQVGHLFPRLLGQSEYDQRLKDAATLMQAGQRWLADHTPASAEPLRLLDATRSPAASLRSPRAARTCSDTPGTATTQPFSLVREIQADAPPRPFPNWLRQRVEAIIWTLKNQLGPERHGSRVPAGLRPRIIQRLLALNAAIWHNWQIGAPVRRSLIAYDH